MPMLLATIPVIAIQSTTSPRAVKAARVRTGSGVGEDGDRGVDAGADADGGEQRGDGGAAAEQPRAIVTTPATIHAAAPTVTPVRSERPVLVTSFGETPEPGLDHQPIPSPRTPRTPRRRARVSERRRSRSRNGHV
jgi:hypothetical protein